MLLEVGLENIDGMENHIQGIEDARDGEVAFLPRAIDVRKVISGSPDRETGQSAP
jgi:hypothetical protein